MMEIVLAFGAGMIVTTLLVALFLNATLKQEMKWDKWDKEQLPPLAGHPRRSPKLIYEKA